MYVYFLIKKKYTFAKNCTIKRLIKITQNGTKDPGFYERGNSKKSK